MAEPMTGKTKSKAKTRWFSHGRSLWPFRYDAKGKSLFLKRVEYRTVEGPFFDEYEWREEKPKKVSRAKPAA
jgi:hypothetical protein